MRVTVNIHEAKTHLSRLVAQAVAGDEVLIAKAGKPMVRMVRVEPVGRRRLIGAAKGEIWISRDFDAPLPEFESPI